MRAVFVGLVAAAVAGCASAPLEMHYYPKDLDPANAIAWPGPPEDARIVYAGELTGESNFRPVEGAEDGTAVKVLRWIAGIAGGSDRVVELIRPQTGMVDDRGRILVTDAGRQAVLVFDEAAAELQVWDEARPGQSFLSPVGIVADGLGGYLVADADRGHLVRLDGQGRPVGTLGDGYLMRPTGLARDAAAAEIYVADSAAHDIKVFDEQGSLLRTLGTRGVSAGQFNGPTHLCFMHGKLYVTDTLNARVQIVSPDGQALGDIGKRGLFVGNLVRPKGVVSDRDGNVYVVESYYDHLLIFNESGELLLPIGGSGSTTGRFFLPAGAWTGNGDRLFVADMFNGRVVVFDYLGDTQ